MNFIDRWTLPNGTPLAVRHVRAHDAPSLNDLIEGLPRRDLRWRFHGAVNGVSPDRLQRMACVDPLRELALVVISPAPMGERVIADVRCVIDASGHGAEFALMVAAGWRRRGIGQRALLALRCSAGQRGLRWLHGSVLGDNQPMLTLLHRCGFACTPDCIDRTLISTKARTHHA